MIRKGRRSALRKGRFSQAGVAYFVTKCVPERRRQPLRDADRAMVVIDALVWASESRWVRILGFVVMPDHVHAILGLGEGVSLQDVMRRLGSFTARRINKILGRSGQFWEEGFYDHGIRDRMDFDAILEYVHQNPVVAGLAKSPEEWPFSTAHPHWAPLIDWEWLGFSVPREVKTKHRFRPEKLPFRYR